MNVKKIIITAFLLVIGGFFILVFFYPGAGSKKSARLDINGKIISAEIADDPIKREKGLGGRTSLCEDCGMLFVFEQRDIHTFWMKGMKFPLDIIWIDGHDVVYIAENVSHNFKGLLKPDILADKVLEINSGLAKKLSVEIGDELNIE